MTTISIKEDLNLDRNSFETLEEFQHYMMLKKQNIPFSEKTIALIKERIQEADLCEEPGLTWEQVKQGLSQRKND